MISKLNLICRWAYPKSCGGIAMHNYFLLKAIKKRIQCETVSFDSLENSKFYEKSDIVFTGISPNSYINRMHQLKFAKLKDASRFISDRYISKCFEKILKNRSGLFEFMDIHSEGYYFLKNNPEKRYFSIIRSHTPFTLLKKYFNKSELKGVDTWFSNSSERKIFNWAEHITTPSKDLKNQLTQLFDINSNKINVIPNVIDTGYFKPIKIEPSDCFNILHVGRFERAKGVETLIKAFIHLAKIYKDQNRDDLAQIEDFQAKIIHAFLPKQMGEEEVKVILINIIEELGASSSSDMGKVMGKAMGQLKGKAPGDLISSLVKELLK